MCLIHINAVFLIHTFDQTATLIHDDRSAGMNGRTKGQWWSVVRRHMAKDRIRSIQIICYEREVISRTVLTEHDNSHSAWEYSARSQRSVFLYANYNTGKISDEFVMLNPHYRKIVGHPRCKPPCERFAYNLGRQLVVYY